MRPSPSLPENFDELVSEAIQLKREVPSRSISQIILILEMEGLLTSSDFSISKYFVP